ncbi:autophagy associated protein kinase regulatory subunit Atg13 [Schizosaccharomyces japonicus yFS275]|uniref:Autophagy-related protein 13 n=1 Tax=Schizosaccharomyces japonicus (strain yFS275 / FY16936) TaxID=402676 RepID=B6K082_SCHJY|nr:autophagy associated protein kinase regulatory subunit Atg13 [Schizosaccharomyces japonicus yFS275]EEB06232.1 autophagy associated protein kinase regulatory subunit Atg13 [Schizosaccharomyces japonicus yFS275]
MQRNNIKVPPMFPGQRAVAKETAPPGGLRNEHSPLEGKTSKISQLIHSCFNKASEIIVDARVSLEDTFVSKRPSKLNRWFNLEIEEIDVVMNQFKYWKTFNLVTEPVPPPMIIHVYLDTSGLSSTQVLQLREGAKAKSVYLDRNSSNKIVLERWVVCLDGTVPVPTPELTNVYKRCTVLFRSLYTYARIMPVWQLKRRLSWSHVHCSKLKLGYAVVSDPSDESDYVSVNCSLIEGVGSKTEMFSFGKVETPVGIFKVSVQYRTHCDFNVRNTADLMPNAHANTTTFTVGDSVPTESPSSSPHSHLLEDGGGYGLSSPKYEDYLSQIELPESLDPNDASYILSNGIRKLSINEKLPLRYQPVVSIHPFKSPSLSASPGQNFDASSISPKVTVNKFVHRGPSYTSLRKLSSTDIHGETNTSPETHIPSNNTLPPPTDAMTMTRTPSFRNRRFSSSFGPRDKFESASYQKSIPLLGSAMKGIFKKEETPTTTGPAKSNFFDSSYSSQNDISAFVQFLDTHADKIQQKHTHKLTSSDKSGFQEPPQNPLQRRLSDARNPALQASNFSDNSYVGKSISDSASLKKLDCAPKHSLASLRSRLSFSDKPSPLQGSPLRPNSLQQQKTAPHDVFPANTFPPNDAYLDASNVAMYMKQFRAEASLNASNSSSLKDYKDTAVSASGNNETNDDVGKHADNNNALNTNANSQLSACHSAGKVDDSEQRDNNGANQTSLDELNARKRHSCFDDDLLFTMTDMNPEVNTMFNNDNI